MFEHLQAIPPDPILGLIAAYAADPNPKKIDLGIGLAHVFLKSQRDGDKNDHGPPNRIKLPHQQDDDAKETMGHPAGEFSHDFGLRF